MLKSATNQLFRQDSSAVAANKWPDTMNQKVIEPSAYQDPEYKPQGSPSLVPPLPW
jgi:hypothetical protein